MSAKETGVRKDSQGLARQAMNQASDPKGEAVKPQPAYIGASGKPNFARRNG